MNTLKKFTGGKPETKLNVFANCYDQSVLSEAERLWNAMVNEQISSNGIVTLDRFKELGRKDLRLQVGDDFFHIPRAQVETVKEEAIKRIAALQLLEQRMVKAHALKFLGSKKWNKEIENVIANVGFEGIGQILIGSYGGTGEVTYAALGSGSTTPTASGTQLTTEVYRNAMFSGTASSNITYLTAVYNETETSGTYNEFGNFIDGTGTANSGLLWSWILTGGWVKTTSDVLVVDQKYTFTSS